MNNGGVKTFSTQKQKFLNQVRHALKIKHYSTLEIVELVVEKELWNLDKSRKSSGKIINIKVRSGEVKAGRLVREPEGMGVNYD